MNPAVIALILQSWWRLLRLGLEDRFQYALAVLSGVATWRVPGSMTLVFLAAGVMGAIWYF